ncbi:MAG: hypothetical protein AAFQ62_08210 [Pseudomonadota bacterium]
MDNQAKSLASALALATLCGAASADPEISSVDGTLTDESIIEILGTDFGTPDSPTPYFFDQVDQAWINGDKVEAYTSVADDSLVPVGGSMPWKDNEGSVYLERSGSFRGVRNSVYEGRFSGNDAWIGDPAGIPDPSAGDTRQLYISWYFKPDYSPTSSDNGAGGSHKFIRVWDSSGSSPDARVSWTQMHLTYDGGGPSWKSFNGQVNQWNRMELYLSLDSNTINARVNGSNLHTINNFSEPQADGLVPRLLGFDGSGDAEWNNATWQITDYYVTNSRARVEIKSTPTWSETSVGELQIPVQWNNNQIQFRLNRGAIASLDAAYLYVVDENGNVNQNGFPLCQSDCPSPPESPGPF